MKKILMLASVASMIGQFNMDNITLLEKLGCEVHVACNFAVGNTCSQQKIEELKHEFKLRGVAFFQIDFTRNIYQIKKHYRAFQQLSDLIATNKYYFIHCHSPIGGALGRLIGHKAETDVIYTAHGFHFYKGAHLKNWLVFYPIEKILAYYTKILITINCEDYKLAKSKFNIKKIEYIPGIGVDLERLKAKTKGVTREEIRKKLDVTCGIMILSVGELSERKNHEVMINALEQITMKYPQFEYKYFIAGLGKCENALRELIKRRKLENKIILLGFRDDIPTLLMASDLFAFPSKQEGLPVALMEAMAMGLPVICSDIRGNNELIKDGEGGYLAYPTDIEQFVVKLETLLFNEELRGEFSVRNQIFIKEYSKEAVQNKMEKIYSELLNKTEIESI